jgi:protein involved in temperature-dependent protein secretion
MEALMAAIRVGDYAKAYDALRYTSKAATPAGAAIGAFLLAMLERFDEAEQLASITTLDGIATIVRGERERSARWRDPAASSGLRMASETPTGGLYAAMGAAFAQRDAELADRTRAELAAQGRPVAGRLTFANGDVKPFRDIADADDAIGRMLEAYGDDGLMYFPFEGLHRIAARPRKNFIDQLMPQIEVTDARGTMLVYVPLLYAGSATASLGQLRNGRATIFEYLGSATRGRGQRDFRVDDALVGLQNIAAIDFAIAPQ